MSHDESDRSGYLGAMLDENRRLVLIPLDPERPWAAFRRMRAWMKRARPRDQKAGVEILDRPETSAGAEVIPLRRNQRDR
ncbi:MAG: hypothetical protein ACRDKS_10920 [Actinomycetota bacterium]